ncbi:mannose-1-phosphate guanylyltransferase/mannose-6-phosphate isomerase [Vibrio cyclitrophicus]
MILPIILAGGSGSRLWPMSRAQLPKQFLSLVSNTTMLQDTVHRLRSIPHKPCMFICNEEHRFMLAEQLRQADMPHSGILLEPVGRNTAPAIALAAIQACENGDDPLLLVLAADHVIANPSEFSRCIARAVPLAEKGRLVTFGIVPTSPETGYGYIKQGASIDGYGFAVDAFVEKPDLDAANRYLTSGNYLWNSGMFLFRASRFLEELSKHQPKILSQCQAALDKAKLDLDFIRLDSEAFKACPDDSIDYAVMEKTDSAAVVSLDAGWSDVGSWSALWEVSNKDESGNSLRGDVFTDQTKGSYVIAQDRLVATVGVENLVVVETKDAVLVAHMDKVQDVKNIVNSLKAQNRSEYLQHREIYRPWGEHEHVTEGERYHVKKVTVKPGGRTATQIHHHRTEHWIVVSGTAKVRNGEETFIVCENESTFIPVGAPHSFENPGILPLELIEVRTGAYLEEDDIIRVDDKGEGY